MERRSFLGRFGVGAAGLLVPPAVLAEAPPATVRVQVLATCVAGVQYHAAMLPAVAATLRPGRLLVLRPEPDNPHDPDAVAVTVGEMGARIGYVPRRGNPVLAALLRGGARVTAEIVRFNPAAPPWERVEMAVFVEAAHAPAPVDPFAWQPTGLVVPVTNAAAVAAATSSGPPPAGARRTRARPAAPDDADVLPGYVWVPGMEEAEREARPGRSSLARTRAKARGHGLVADTLDDLHDAAQHLEGSLKGVGRATEAAASGVEALPERAAYGVRHVAGGLAGQVEVTVQGAGAQAWQVVRTVERHANARSRQANAVVNAVLDVLG